jgi:xylan 1,4-beta-xylosidase
MTRRVRMYDFHRSLRPMHFFLSVIFSFLVCQFCWPQEMSQTINIQVRYDQSEGSLSPVWNYFGYDEPNYTYAPDGRKLLAELAAANTTPAYVRTHNLLTSGDGSASLKWGSTNVYSEHRDIRSIAG